MSEHRRPDVEPEAVIDEATMAMPLAPTTDVSGARGAVVRGSAYSVAGLAITGIGGALFWLIAARLYPSVAVGQASGLFTSVMLLNFITNLGLPVAIARFGHGDREETDAIFTRALIASVASSLLAAALFIVLVDRDVVVALTGRGLPAAVAFFGLLVAGSSMAILVDVRLMLARAWSAVLFRMAVVGVLRLPLLWAQAPVGDAVWLLVLAAGFPAASGFVGVAALPRLTGARFGMRHPVSGWPAVMRFAGVNYLSTLAVDAARFVLPVIVLVNVTPTVNASFYVAWSITMIAFLVPATIGQVLLVEAARTDDRWAHVRTAAAVSIGLMAVTSAAAWLRADAVTAVFGSGYRPAADILPRLLAAAVPWAVTSVALADARARGDTRATLGLTGTLALTVLLPAAVLVPDRGAAAAADVWLGGHLVTAALAAFVLLRSRMGHRAAVGASVP